MKRKVHLSLRDAVQDAVTVVIGAALVAAGLVMFTVPNNIAPGGVSGLATVLAHITPIGVGVWTLLLNLPLVGLAWLRLGFKPLAKTFAATVLLSVLIDVFTPILPAYTNNPLLAAVLGGALFGLGMGALFVRGASTGGTDLVSILLNRIFPNLSVGSLLMAVDALVVVFAVCVFKDIDVALYSIVTIFVTTKGIDSITQGVDFAKVIYVVSEHGDEINRVLANEMEMGVTILNARGGYTGRDKEVLMVVVRRNVFSQTLRTIKMADPRAFLFVTNATEVHGEGFKPME